MGLGRKVLSIGLLAGGAVVGAFVLLTWAATVYTLPTDLLDLAKALAPTINRLTALDLRVGICLTVVLIAVGLFVAVGPALLPSRNKAGVFVELRDAGRSLYEHGNQQTRETLRSQIPDLFPGIAEHGACFFIDAARKDVCQLWGRYDRALPHEKILPSDADTTAFDAVFGDDSKRHRPIDISVKRRDLKRVLKWYESDAGRRETPTGPRLSVDKTVARIEIESVEPNGSAFIIVNPSDKTVSDGLVKLIGIDGIDNAHFLPIALRTQRQRKENRGGSFNLRAEERKKVPFCLPSVATETDIPALAGPADGEKLIFHVGCYGGSRSTSRKIEVQADAAGLKARLVN